MDTVEYYLLEDIRSTFWVKAVYGHKGDKVKQISRHDEVIIVEGKSGRFSVTIDKLIKIK